LVSVKKPNFPRKESKKFAQYISERPEKASHEEKPKKAKTTNHNEMFVKNFN